MIEATALEVPTLAEFYDGTFTTTGAIPRQLSREVPPVVFVAPEGARDGSIELVTSYAELED